VCSAEGHTAFYYGLQPVECALRVSQQRNEARMKQKPTCYAGGDKKLNKETPFHYNRVVQSLLQERKGVYGEEVMRSRPYKMDV
jgi:hypothetical protein